MIFITGDTHGDIMRPLRYLENRDIPYFPEDYLIILGDFGGIWRSGDNEKENEKLDRLNNRGITTLFIDGNHEHFDRLYSDEFETIDYLGGRAKRIRDNIYWLMRGEIYTIEGRTFFTMGGGQSHDIKDGIVDFSQDKFDEIVGKMTSEGKQFRIKNISWWPEEIPSEEEFEHGRQNLLAHGNKVDFILTHAAPSKVAAGMGFKDKDSLSKFLDEVYDKVQYETWFFGHYHRDEILPDGFYTMHESMYGILNE